MIGSNFSRFREELRPPPEPEPERPDPGLAVLQAVAELKEALQHLPVPEVHVPPVDLAELVTAVTSLRPGATAEDIADALADRIMRVESPAPSDAVPVLTEVAKKLEELSFRLQGVGTQAYGGGSVTLQNNHGLLTETTFTSRFPDLTGTWGYKAGTTGTPDLPADARVVGISAVATTAGSFTINGGDTVTVPANSAVAITPNGNLVDPTLVFTGTSAFFVEYVS